MIRAVLLACATAATLKGGLARSALPPPSPSVVSHEPQDGRCRDDDHRAEIRISIFDIRPVALCLGLNETLRQS